jgi:anti-sigma B factor antagonist
MEVKIEQKEKYTQITVLNDKLDTTVAPELKSELVVVAGKGERNMILDIGQCQYCDSSGLSAILVANRLCKNANGTFIVTGMNPEVERLVKISQLHTVLNIAESMDEAVGMLNGQ